MPEFPLSRAERDGDRATAGIIKDAGDDPDVTHGAEVVVTVRPLAAGSGVVFRAGAGVGTVTLPGLPLAVGEPAINPAPRRMIAEVVADDVEVTIAIPGGEALALKTANGRLGIVGGLSVLGTTGVVVPYSCASWISSIHRGIDVARALGYDHVAAATGRTSEAAVQRLTGLPETALIDMGDFAGGMLKYLRRHPVAKVTIAGGFAKISELAAGHMDLHSSRSRVDRDRLADTLGRLGGPAAAVAAARQANTALHILTLAGALATPLADQVAAEARGVALATLAGGTDVAVVIVDRSGNLLGHAGD